MYKIDNTWIGAYMRITISGELADELIIGGKRHGTNPAEHLERCIAIYEFLLEQEATGQRILIEDSKANTVQRILVSDDAVLDEADHIALWDSEVWPD